VFLDRNYYFRGEKPIIIPHRGGINVVPENTLHALEHTVEHNFTHFETDLRMTKDGEIILNHDATIDRTTHEKGNISELNWKDLKKINAGSKFYERKDLNRKNRGVKQSGFWVLHNTYMPSILIEAGFMTNPDEGAYLNSKRGQVEISNSIYDAIIKYKKAINYSGDFEIKSNIKNSITYKVQIAAGKRRLELKSYNFKGLSNISRIKQGSIYKYFYSSSKSLTEIKKKKPIIPDMPNIAAKGSKLKENMKFIKSK